MQLALTEETVLSTLPDLWPYAHLNVASFFEPRLRAMVIPCHPPLAKDLPTEAVDFIVPDARSQHSCPTCPDLHITIYSERNANYCALYIFVLVLDGLGIVPTKTPYVQEKDSKWPQHGPTSNCSKPIKS